jgi:hypothetical protein
MRTRDVVLGGSLLLICLLAFLTLRVLVREGVDVLVIVSLVILALLGFGVIGALTSPPPDE